MKSTHYAKLGFALIVGAAFVVSACGERPQVVQYKSGSYSGKTDTRPYESAAYNGDKTKWESDIRARGQNQNEYKRIP